MDRPTEPSSSGPSQFPPAPLPRRIGAHLLDSAIALLLFYLGLQAMSLTYGFGAAGGDLYLALYHSFIIGWVLLKDSWWPGQSLGKRVARIFITDSTTQTVATRLQGVKRQAIFILLVGLIYFPAYLAVSRDPIFLRMGFLATLLSVVAPIRLLTVIGPAYSSGGPLFVAQLLVLGFMLVETFLVYRRPDRRRIVDLLARTQVVGDTGPRVS